MTKIETFLNLSKRTIGKILSRANCVCSICGWNEASCDLHHITPRGKGGTDQFTNLICVCPNCHRKLHVHGERFVTKDELHAKSLQITLPNWIDFYNPSSSGAARICKKIGAEFYTKTCFCCGNKIPNHLKFCSSECRFSEKKPLQVTKEELEKLVTTMSLLKISKLYGVSDNAIRKRCKKLGVALPNFQRGYWSIKR
jgi:predicted nucleic acid-binding Zn ribbon protein